MTKEDAVDNLGKLVTVWNYKNLQYEEAKLLEYHADSAECLVELFDLNKRILKLSDIHLGSPDELQGDIMSDVSVELPENYDLMYEDGIEGDGY